MTTWFRSARAAAGKWGVAAIAALACTTGLPAFASSSGVVISQLFTGGGTTGPFASDYVELFNAGTAPVSIAGWSIQYASSTGTGPFSGNGISVLSGTLLPGQYHLVKLNTAASGTALPTPDTNGSNTTNLAATAGKVALVNIATGLACNGSSTPCIAAQLAQIVDLVGYGAANFFEGAAAPAATATTALFRAAGGCTDTNQNSTDFSNGVPAPRNSSTALAPCGGPPPVSPIVPSCPATVTVAAGAAVDTTLTASDLDSIVNSAAFVSGNVSGMSLTAFTTAPAIGGSASVKLSLSGAVAAGTYPVVVSFGNDDAQTANCTVNVTVSAVGAFTPIYDIQGSGNSAALLGVRTTRGVVTKVNNNGYYLQDQTGDGNPLTSDGIFVFTSTAPTVVAGQLVQITGTVSEFNTGAATNAETLARTLTEFSNITATTVLGTGSITPTVITFPVATQGDLERYEGMLVQITTPLTASQNFFQGRYGQVTLSANGRLIKPTNLYRPGTPLAISQADLNARSSLMLDDGTSVQNPNPTPYIGADNTLRAGDTLASGIVGVIDYGLATADNTGIAMYRIHPTVAPVFTRSNPRTAAPAAVGGNVKVASFNVLNFFTTFTDGTTAAGGIGEGCSLGGAVSAANCRGADSLAEFTRQRTKIVKAMVAINADVLGLMEIQNNGNTAAQNLVDALNAENGSTVYAVVPLPPTTGTDAIRVAMIYKPGALALSGSPMSDSDPIHNRPPFAHAFAAPNGEKFSVIVNHFKSKGSCPTSGVDIDQGDGQGCWNDRRKQQSTALLGFIGTVQAAAGDNDVLIIGDLNAYGVEDPVDTLTMGGLVNQVSRFDAAGYSYVFDGEAGYIDHALASSSLSAQITGAAHWHVNADEPSIIDYNAEFKQPACATCGPDYYSATPYRASDHDPVVIGLNLVPPAATQTITFATPADRALNSGSFNVVASASSGLAIAFSATPAPVCTVSASGTVTLVSAGVCTLQANQPGNASFAAAPTVSRSFNVTASALLTQSTSFAAIASRALDSGAFTLSATASSGLVVSFNSLTASVCSVTGNTVALLTVGTCTIAADQAGNATYAAAPQVQQSFVVGPVGGTGGGSADIPTLPEWGAILMGLMLLTLGMRRRLKEL